MGYKVTFYNLSAFLLVLLSLSPENGVQNSYFFLKEKSLLVLIVWFLSKAVLGTLRVISLIVPSVDGLGLMFVGLVGMVY
jgi:hypothetical protein